MAEKKESKGNPTPDKKATANAGTERQIPNNVISLAAHKCCAESCKAKPDRAGFCSEHYVWFKEGLLTLEGYKAKDFDKKFHAMARRKSA